LDSVFTSSGVESNVSTALAAFLASLKALHSFDKGCGLFCHIIAII
jgi:hypothetical protein